MNGVRIVSSEKKVSTQRNHSQWLFKFENGLSISVVNGDGTYGWESALFDKNGQLVYDGGVFSDVVPFMDAEETFNMISLVGTFSPDHKVSKYCDGQSDFAKPGTPENKEWLFYNNSDVLVVISEPLLNDVRTALDYLHQRTKTS